jgi:hypothetical protein
MALVPSDHFMTDEIVNLIGAVADGFENLPCVFTAVRGSRA